MPNTKPELTAKQIKAGWEHTFSTNNPFCPCDLKSFTKAVNWAERALAATAPNAGREALGLVIEAWDRYCGGGRTENDAETFVIVLNAARRDATPPQAPAAEPAAPAQQAGGIPTETGIAWQSGATWPNERKGVTVDGHAWYRHDHPRLSTAQQAGAPLPSDVQALIEELDNAAGRLTQWTNSPLDGLLNAAARKLEELAGAPLSSQQVVDRFSFLEGLVSEETYRKIADAAIEIQRAAGAPLPLVPSDAAYAPLTGRMHDLKTDGPVFMELRANRKLFELRKDDRGFQCGDLLRLRETRCTGAEMAAGQPLIYTGAEELRRVVGILRGPKYGLEAGWVILSVATCAPPQADAAEHHGLDTAERVCFYEQDFYVLSNFSSFRLTWRGLIFDTSEAAYHYEKFCGGDGSVAHEIMGATSAHEAFKIAERNKAHRRPDWDEVKVGIMRNILRAKADQHEYVRRKLLDTGNRLLVENSWRDDYWGWGQNRDGQNMLGKLWMEIRAELQSAAAAQAPGARGEQA